MTDEQILECIKVTYDYLCDDGNPTDYNNFNEFPSLKKMEKTLINYGFDMIDFCKFINDKYNFYEKPFCVLTARELFSDELSENGRSKAKVMLNTLLRDYKLKNILC